MPKKSTKDRCWPGYEPVPGKQQHEQGSCRPKAKAKLNSSEKKFRSARERQLENWENAHPGKRRSAAQHLHAPGARPKKQRGAAASRTK